MKIEDIIYNECAIFAITTSDLKIDLSKKDPSKKIVNFSATIWKKFKDVNGNIKTGRPVCVKLVAFNNIAERIIKEYKNNCYITVAAELMDVEFIQTKTNIQRYENKLNIIAIKFHYDLPKDYYKEN